MLGLCAWVVVIELDEADIPEHGKIMFNVHCWSFSITKMVCPIFI